MKALDRIECTNDGTRFYLGGKEVSEADYRREHPAPRGLAGSDALVKFKPIKSVAMEVGDVPGAMEEDKKRGFTIEYTPHGRPIYTSSRQMRDHCRSYGFVHKGYP